MKMLPKYWRYWFIQNTVEVMDYDAGARIAIRTLPWKIESGNLVYGNVITEDCEFSGGETIALGVGRAGSPVNNSSNLYEGVKGTFEITHDSDGAIGSCRLFLEYSDEDGNWPSASNDHVITDLILLKILPIDNQGADRSRSVNFSF